MPGKPGKQQGLFDDGSLIGFLQSTLEAMESAAGGQLSEERAKLQELQLALGGLGVAASKPAETDEVVLASQLDKLEQQLQTVEQQISTADNCTKQLLTKSTVVWAGGHKGVDNADASNDYAGGEDAATSAGGSGTRTASAGMDKAVESGLLTVPEQAEEDAGN